jgi:hypothetical protein
MSFVFKYKKELKDPKTTMVENLESVKIKDLENGKFEIEQSVITDTESSTHRSQKNTKSTVNTLISEVITELKRSLVKEITILQGCGFVARFNEATLFAEYDHYTITMVVQMEDLSSSDLLREMKKIAQYLEDYLTDQMVVASEVEKQKPKKQETTKKEARV